MTDPETYREKKAANLEAYEQLKHDIPQKYSGQYVVIGKGRILLSAPTYEDAWQQVKQIAPDMPHFLIFPADKGPFLETVKVRRHGKVYLSGS